LAFHPASLGDPALRTLSPPPVKVNLVVRRGITVPSRLLPLCRHGDGLIGPLSGPSCPHDGSEPGNSASLTPEEGLIQLQVRTQQPDSNTRLGYGRGFEHIRGLNPRTHPIPALPQIYTISVPISTRLDDSDDAAIVTRSEGSLIGLISESSSDEPEPSSTRPDDATLGITITRSRKGSNAPSDHLHFSSRARADNYELPRFRARYPTLVSLACDAITILRRAVSTDHRFQ